MTQPDRELLDTITAEATRDAGLAYRPRTGGTIQSMAFAPSAAD